MNSNNASKMDEENSSVLKRFKNNNIIKIDNIGIITNVDKKNVLIYYKVIKNSDINDLSEEFTSDSSQVII